MAITNDLLGRRAASFALWCPRAQVQIPQLIIGELQAGNPPTLKNVQQIPFAAVAGASGLYTIDPATCHLAANTAYHYWFEVDDSRSTGNPPARIAVTDPFAGSVDWRIFPPGDAGNSQPAAVIQYVGASTLAEGDPNGETAQFEGNDQPDQLPPNNQMVIYEMPTAWALSRSLNEPERDVATFLDVAALVDERIGGANFSDLSILAPGQAYLVNLGINALELLPASDSYFKREWGYDTSHYLAPDYELGFPEGNLSPTANRDLATLVSGCHRKNIRFFIDAVMAFAHEEPYNHIDAPDFCMDDPSADPGDPDSHDSRGGLRDGFGSTLWRYAKQVNTYDPVTGATALVYPARQLMLSFLTRWMRDFRVDGVRMDSVENVANWDFIESFKDLGRQEFSQRWTDDGLNPADGANARFLVVGEELSLPPALLTESRLDALWNKSFSDRVRAAIQGQPSHGDDFEWTVRKIANCLLDQNGGNPIFTDGAQAVNYFTSHDVEGAERLFTMLQKAGNSDDLIEKRIKLAFVCLMTAVGIPMFLAGEEFADQHDLFDRYGNVSENGGKQIDPVNYGRLTAGPPGPNDTAQSNPDAWYGPMRQRIFAYVKALIQLRITAPALAVNDTDFIMTDFNGKQVVVWQRGGAVAAVPVIVVANFSDFYSAPGTDYVIPNWPQPTPAGKKWREMTQSPNNDPNNLGRDVDPNWVGREAIYPWEAKVYTLVDV